MHNFLNINFYNLIPPIGYNVKIELADSLRDRRFYGSFTIVGNTVDEVLRKMASTNQMRYSVKDKKYIIY